MESFTPELKRLLVAAGCGFVRAGKGDLEESRKIIGADLDQIERLAA